MHIEGGDNSIGFFPEESRDEYIAAALMYFKCLEYLINSEVIEVTFEYKGSEIPNIPKRISVTPLNMIAILYSHGISPWRIVKPEEASRYELYYDICLHFITLIAPVEETEAFQEVTFNAVEIFRNTQQVSVTANWDAQFQNR
jgi:hypothetical protein